ncbi:MAG: hypothetical protein K6L75_12295 [Cellvibrionaceae bacterium]
MTVILFIHLMAIGIWAGCLAIETVCELDQENVHFKDSYIAALHWKIDKFVEIPALLITLVTGSIMLANAPSNPILMIKIIAGLLAVFFNAIAVFLIYKRYHCYLQNDEVGYKKYEMWHHRFGLGCIVSVITAIVAGGYYITGFAS